MRSAEDAAAQHLMHRHNALARSLNDSTCLSPETAAQRVPYATARTSAAGSDTAARLMALLEGLEQRQAKLNYRLLHGSADEIADASRQIDEVVARIRKLKAELADIGTGRGYRGRPDIYRVSVPALSYGGGMEGEQAAECWTLNTHDLPEDVRAWLTGYLLSGAQAMPYRLRNGRYNPQSNVSADMRSNLRVIWSHLLPETPWLASSEPAKSA